MAREKDGEKLNTATAGGADAVESASDGGSADVLDVSEKWLEDIKYWLGVFCDEYGIDDLSTVSQNRFNAALRMAGKNVFVDTRILKNTSLVPVANPPIGIGGNIISQSNHNTYDIDLVYRALDLYIYLCDIYDKAVSIYGFTAFSGIDNDTLYKWSGDNKPKFVSNRCTDFIKTLKTERERSLSDILVTAKRNPVGVLGVLNHESGWNMPGVSREKSVKVALSASDLPSLGGSGAGVRQIAQNQGGETDAGMVVKAVEKDSEKGEKMAN